MLLLGETFGQGQQRLVTSYGEPVQAYVRPGLRRVGGVVVDAPADAAVAGDEAGVALGHRGLDLLVARVDEVGGGEPVVGELPRGRGEGARHLLEVGREQVVGDAERVVAVDHEVLRVHRGRGAGDGPHHRGGVDDPVLQGVPARGEDVRRASELEAPPVGVGLG